MIRLLKVNIKMTLKQENALGVQWSGFSKKIVETDLAATHTTAICAKRNWCGEPGK
jgi:hypothetical protein